MPSSSHRDDPCFSSVLPRPFSAPLLCPTPATLISGQPSECRLSRPPPPDSPSCPEPSPQVSPGAAAPERAVEVVGRGGGRFWGLSRRWCLCHRIRRFLPLLPLSAFPTVSLNFQRRAPIGRVRIRPRPTLEGSGAPDEILVVRTPYAPPQ